MNHYKTVFIFAYYSYTDPVFQSAVLPYFIGLNKLEPKLRFVLLTFEQKKFRLKIDERKKIRNDLLQQNILWYNTNWHSGRLKLIKKIYDIIQTSVVSTYLILRYDVNIIYSEGFPGAVLGHWLSKLFQKKHIVHTYEPHTQYMVEAGVWEKDSWEAKWLSKYEHKVAKSAAVILTATQAMIDKLKNLNIQAAIHRVPSCVDTGTFNFSLESRLKIRKEYGIKDDEIVIASLGKFGGMYLEHEVFDFFKVCEEFESIKFKYFIFTGEDESNILKFIRSNNIPKDKFLIKNLLREEVSSFLSAADFGLVGVRQNPGKRFCSPIKDGEYWACGLPIIIPEGISDDYLFTLEENIGIVMKDLSNESYRKVCNEVKDWQLLDMSRTKKLCRKFAKKDRDVSSFNDLYISLFLEIQ